MKRKVLLIVSGIELIISLYYTLTAYRDGLTELFLAFYIFLGAVLLALVIKPIIDCFTPKSSWVPYVFLHCLTCPGIFYFVCLAVPDFAKNAYETYCFYDKEMEYNITINTYMKEFHGSIYMTQMDGRRHWVNVSGKYIKEGQKMRLSSKSVTYYRSPICKEEKMFFDSFKKDLYMDKDSIYGLNGKNYALQRFKEME